MSRILFFKPQAFRRKVELGVRVLLLRFIVRYVLVRMIRVSAAVVAIKRGAEVRTAQQVAEVLVQMRYGEVCELTSVRYSKSKVAKRNLMSRTV
jgi:hypothetical protein